MNELALFAGGGGGLLASQWLKGWRTICYVERATYPARIIEARIRDGFLDDAPVWDDVRTFDGYPWRGFVDVITAGFPCQPFSVAGKRKAAEDPRNGWPDTIRIIREVQPRWCFLENVPGLLAASHGYFGVILRELAESGYDASWRVLSAAELGAPHKRDRLWIVAHRRSLRGGSGGIQQERFTKCEGSAVFGDDGTAQSVADASIARIRRLSTGQGGQKRATIDPCGCGEDVAYPERSRRNGRAGTQRPSGWIESEDGDCPRAFSEGTRLENGRPTGASESQGETNGQMAQPGFERCSSSWWAVEPGLDRVANGVAFRVDRIKAIGNGQVPAVAATAWNLLTRE